jgi:hypothetical protein
MDMTWENLTKLYTWAAQHESDAPLADTAGEQFVVDSAITKEELESVSWPLTRSCWMGDAPAERELWPFTDWSVSGRTEGVAAEGEVSAG